MNQSFFRTCLRFYIALVIFERQIYVFVEQFEAENTSPLSGRLVFEKNPPKDSHLFFFQIFGVRVYRFSAKMLFPLVFRNCGTFSKRFHFT